MFYQNCVQGICKKGHNELKEDENPNQPLQKPTNNSPPFLFLYYFQL